MYLGRFDGGGGYHFLSTSPRATARCVAEIGRVDLRTCNLGPFNVASAVGVTAESWGSNVGILLRVVTDLECDHHNAAPSSRWIPM
jgi:hypothetical protein